ncbi:nuclear transport factor 2 family protein [Jiangella asiatica]|uniref:Nuclear transport factor 2 family protein n=2 Tax=Jiangella asiatica TaxID=2530372 RepID=A0A4R5DE13_9ACTN|nr:nuclear transport factor 2 family protein [Jiangella asiatica]
MRQVIRTYFDGCNEADVGKMTSCLTDDAVHYFPPGMYGGPFVGAATIARRWVHAVETLGSVWTIDQILTDPGGGRAAAEWTHFKTFTDTVLRGDEWYTFDPASGLITEIRAYYASPQAADTQRLELGGFDYAGRGYALQPPISRGERAAGRAESR